MQRPLRAGVASVVLVGASWCSACQTEPHTNPKPVPVASVQAHEHPVEALNALDSRTPVPLLPMMAWHQKQNMLEHLVAIQRIVEGTAREDWEQVGEASKLIESSPHMEQSCRHMGAGAEGFTRVALDFHERANAIGAAARERNSRAVLRATANTLQACTGCHASYRQEVVTQAAWQARTGNSLPHAASHD